VPRKGLSVVLKVKARVLGLPGSSTAEIDPDSKGGAGGSYEVGGQRVKLILISEIRTFKQKQHLRQVKKRPGSVDLPGKRQKKTTNRSGKGQRITEPPAVLSWVYQCQSSPPEKKSDTK